MSAVIERSGSHPLQVVIPRPALSNTAPKSIRYKHLDRVAGPLPRVSQLVVATCGGYDTVRICQAFKDHPANELQRLSFIASPGLNELFPLYSPLLRSLYLYRVGSWPAPIAENRTHIQLYFRLNSETLERDLKHSPRLKQIEINGVYRVPERPGDHPKISLIPGARLIRTDSQYAVASLFALGPTNYLSITKDVTADNSTASITPFLGFALPRDSISCLRNLNDLTGVHLELTEYGKNPRVHMSRAVVITLRCSTADQEMLHIYLEYFFGSLLYAITTNADIVPERSPAMRALNYLRPLDLGKVAELRMKGFDGEWGLQTFELHHFLQYMPALTHQDW